MLLSSRLSAAVGDLSIQEMPAVAVFGLFLVFFGARNARIPVTLLPLLTY